MMKKKSFIIHLKPSRRLLVRYMYMNLKEHELQTTHQNIRLYHNRMYMLFSILFHRYPMCRL